MPLDEDEDCTYKDELTALVFKLSEFERPSILMDVQAATRLRTASVMAVSLLVLVYWYVLVERRMRLERDLRFWVLCCGQ